MSFASAAAAEALGKWYLPATVFLLINDPAVTLPLEVFHAEKLRVVPGVWDGVTLRTSQELDLLRSLPSAYRFMAALCREDPNPERVGVAEAVRLAAILLAAALMVGVAVGVAITH